MTKNIRKYRIYTLVSIVILLLCEGFFFRNVLFTNRLIGDDGDGRLTALITEHWFRVFRGEISITELGMFYPAQNTLAYSDMLLGFGIIHSILRLFGIELFSVYKITLIFVHLVGTFGTFYLLYKVLKTNHTWALFGTIAFSFSSTYALSIVHTQLAAISILPVALVFLIRFFQSLQTRKKRNIYAYSFIAVMVLILYTSWYIAFFSALFAISFIIIWMILRHYNHEKIIPEEYRKILWKMIPDLIGYFIVFILLVIPFAWLELSVMKATGSGNGFELDKKLIPEVIDIVNFHSKNWLMRGIGEKLHLSSRGLTDEASQGFSVVLVVSFVLFFFLSARRKNSFGEDRKGILLTERAVAWTVVASVLMTIQIGSNGVTFWYIIYALFPGGKAIRAIGRYLFFLGFPLSVITALLGNEIVKINAGNKKKKHIYAAVLTALCAILFLFNITVDGVGSLMDNNSVNKALSGIDAPPEDCKVFFLKSNEEDNRAEPYIQLDAYQIADHFGINTINGYSGMIPDGWNLIWVIKDRDTYLSGIQQWIDNNHLENVYCYDAAENKWERNVLLNNGEENNSDFQPGKLFYPAKQLIPMINYGCFDLRPTGDYSWMAKEFCITLQDSRITEEGLLIRIGMVPEVYERQQPGVAVEAKLYINGAYIMDLSEEGGIREYLVQVNPDPKDTYRIEVKSNSYFNPFDLGDSIDNRDLSMQLYYMGAPAEYP